MAEKIKLKQISDTLNVNQIWDKIKNDIEETVSEVLVKHNDILKKNERTSKNYDLEKKLKRNDKKINCVWSCFYITSQSR